MNLCIDCGNTLIKFGLFKDDKLFLFFSILSKNNLSIDDLSIRITSYIGKYFNEIKGALISSVVPSLTFIIKKAIDKTFNIDSKILNKEIKTKIALKIDNPNELGSDFLATSIGALDRFKFPMLIADLGTTTKISVIDKNGHFIGGMITSGMKLSLESLAKNAAQLFEVPLVLPKRIIGKNTIECIQSGVILGEAFMIKEFAFRMEKELNYPLNKILTGGYSEIIKDELNEFNYERYLSLIGLNRIYNLNFNKD